MNAKYKVFPTAAYHIMPPQLESQHLLQAGHKAKTRARRFWNGFSDFALQDNVLEVAVGLM